ncbi:hypothetical protein [Yersinia enterocolitica]|uniref:F4 family fimbrial subunit n=2 Tax=Yersinia enterocolitica TaxID=630 RepID=UPI001C60B1E0|nr:hypothetical protein [Yersinia enterocolitica]MBW5840158.1 hypothetical protein [Yersinia enterocolitica]MBW5857552.1 hypothetical protein [Yersinia enterocolitica]MBW5866163.1 hypothetical protein [Yersinia enterocolitica]MBW5874852.1 hypothetical protein [Yersinia enterocolitica]
MKKTLIALAVATSAAVSGSAMAWTANGTGNSVDLGGTLTPVGKKITPWEVKTGAAVTGLDAQVTQGQTVVDVVVKNAIPVLGIRTQEVGKSFPAQAGINPAISYQNAVDFDGAFKGTAKLKLVVQDATGTKIGKLEANIFTGAGIARSDAAGGDAYSAYETGNSFMGGIANSDHVMDSLSRLISELNNIDPEITANFTWMDKPDIGTWRSPDFINNGNYSAFYGSGIKANEKIRITLDQGVTGDTQIQWKASLPVTVSYM